MWIASKYGFFSIVLKDGQYHVRARERADLAELLENVPEISAEIESWPDADYRYRVRLPEDGPDIALVFAALCWSVDYANFKSEIAATPRQARKLSAYHKIWSLMQALQK
jgi:hypothetical protein